MIDLLPASKKNAIRKEYRLRIFVVCAAMLSVALAALTLSFFPTYFLVLSRYESLLLESQSDETQNHLSRVKEMETTVQDMNTKIGILQSGASVLRVQDVFDEILESKTRGVTIAGISFDSGGSVSKKGKEETGNSPSITVVGKSADRAALLLFKDSLVQKKEFSTVDLPISSLVKDTDLNFSIRISMSSGNKGNTQ